MENLWRHNKIDENTNNFNNHIHLSEHKTKEIQLFQESIKFTEYHIDMRPEEQWSTYEVFHRRQSGLMIDWELQYKNPLLLKVLKWLGYWHCISYSNSIDVTIMNQQWNLVLETVQLQALRWSTAATLLVDYWWQITNPPHACLQTKSIPSTEGNKQTKKRGDPIHEVGNHVKNITHENT